MIKCKRVHANFMEINSNYEKSKTEIIKYSLFIKFRELTWKI